MARHFYKAQRNNGRARIECQHVRFWSEWFVWISFGGIFERIGGFKCFKDAENWLLGCDSNFYEVASEIDW